MDKKTLEQAQTHYRHGELAKALRCYQQLLQDHPDDIDLWHISGVISAQLKQFDQALKYIDEAIVRNPKVAVFYNSKGNVLLRQHALDSAQEAYQQAIRLKTDYAVAYSNLGNCLYRQGKLIAAEKAYQKALHFEPNLVDAHYNFGILLAKLGEHKQAIDHLIRVTQAKPNFNAAYHQLAQVYLNQGDYPNAIDCFYQQLERGGDQADIYHDLGQALFQANQIDDAIKALEKALVLGTTETDCNHLLGNAFVASNDLDKALNYYLRQLEIEPIVATYYNIGVIFMTKQRHKEAIEYFNHAVKLDPDYLPSHLNLGAIYLKINRLEAARKHYQEASTLAPDNAEIQHILAAITQENTPDAAPKTYLENLFNQYATYYDQHLTEHLRYTVPEQFVQALQQETDIDDASWDILDLGCGTGLSGQQLKPFANTLTGVDISAKMIEQAKQKCIYSSLMVADVLDALTEQHHIDLIVAADVFTYIGKLDSLFAAAYEALKSRGLFIFSVEKTSVEPFELHQSIRYAHSKSYLHQLIEDHHFTLLRFDNLVLRKQKNQDVEGYLILLQK